MPRTTINYQKTIIYKIVCNDLSIKDIYVGQTTDFIRRKCEHKRPSRSELGELHKTINANGGWDNWTMVEIEKFSCNDGNEAKTRLRYWYEKLNANLNYRRPIATEEEKKCWGKKTTVKNKPKTEEEKLKHQQDYKLTYNRLNAEKINAYKRNRNKMIRDEEKRKRQEEHPEADIAYNEV